MDGEADRQAFFLSGTVGHFDAVFELTTINHFIIK
jgi:hypothetical protein